MLSHSVGGSLDGGPLDRGSLNRDTQWGHSIGTLNGGTQLGGHLKGSVDGVTQWGSLSGGPLDRGSLNRESLDGGTQLGSLDGGQLTGGGVCTVIVMWPRPEGTESQKGTKDHNGLPCTRTDSKSSLATRRDLEARPHQ